MENTAEVKGNLENLVKQIVSAEPQHFFVDLKLLPGKKIQVFVDAENGITIEKCVFFSRAIEKVLDQELWLGNDYKLEVSSPGMDSPFKVMEQFHRRVGRDVEVLLLNGTKEEGKLIFVNPEKIEIEKNIKINKKETKIEKIEILFSNIKQTKLILKF